MAVALLTVLLGEGDVDGEGLPGAFELELLPGSLAQPAATIERAMISPRIVCLIVFILEYLGLLMSVPAFLRLLICPATPLTLDS